MTDQEKITFVQAFFDTAPSVSDCTIALLVSKQRIMRQRYGLTGMSESTPFPSQYEIEQCELAVRYIARKGGYGQVTHSENGISRTWASEDDLDILKRIPPLAKVVARFEDEEEEDAESISE